MLDEVFLRLSVLENVVREMKRSQLDLVCLSILEADQESPSLLVVEGMNTVRPGIKVDFDMLESDSLVQSLFDASTGFTSAT